MKIYLVQHAEAKSKDEDPERPLTNSGRQNAQVVANMAARLGLPVNQIRHSGKTRAEQTAKIMAETLNPEQGMTKSEGLSPLDDVEPVAEALSKAAESVMLVGHMPFMERLAGKMVAGNSDLAVVDFRNGGIVCLIQKGDHWQVSGNLTPELAKV
jgi:phosphohistidine phosphatase